MIFWQKDGVRQNLACEKKQGGNMHNAAVNQLGFGSAIA